MEALGTDRYSSAQQQVRSLALRAAELASRWSTEDQRAASPVGPLLLNIGIRELVPHGYKGTARRTVGRLGTAGRAKLQNARHSQVNALVLEARAFAGAHSIVLPRLDRGGNSQALVRKLGSSMDSGNPQSRAAKLERALTGISQLPIVENSAVPAILEARAFQRARARLSAESPPLEDLLGALRAPSSPEAYAAKLGPFYAIEPVGAPAAAALRSLGSTDSESLRQGLGSLRVALDALIEHVAGKGPWNEAAARLRLNDQERKVLGATHHLLSRGSHHGTQISKSDLQLALDLFVSVGTFLLSRAGLSP
jgi:hypothetical protein